MRIRRLASSVENSADRDVKQATVMITRLTVTKKMTPMKMIAMRTTTRKRTISMTTIKKMMKTAKLSIQWKLTMAMNSLMSVLIQLAKTSMRLSGSSILYQNGSFLSKVVESLRQVLLLLLRRKIVKTVRQRSLVGAVNPNVVLIMRILKGPPEDATDTKPSATRGTQHLLDTTSIETTRTNIMMKSHLKRIDTANTVTIADQRMSCHSALNIVMVRIMHQLSQKIKVMTMG